MSTIDISFWRLGSGYLMLLIPLAIMLWLRVPMVGQTLLAVVRMTVQLLFVGFYLQVIFALNSLWATGAWLLVMVIVADLSIIRGCNLRLRRLAGGVFLALLIGVLVPLLFFVLLVLDGPAALDAQYLIPIGGMILGNCLRADIIGIRTFYEALRKQEKAYLLRLAQGATLREALFPYLQDAWQASLAPTIATMSTMGLVALPGMMTGVILGGGNPMTAIKYQIAIVIAIFVGTGLTVILAIRLTVFNSFSAWGTLDRELFLNGARKRS